MFQRLTLCWIPSPDRWRGLPQAPGTDALYPALFSFFWISSISFPRKFLFRAKFLIAPVSLSRQEPSFLSESYLSMPYSRRTAENLLNCNWDVSIVLSGFFYNRESPPALMVRQIADNAVLFFVLLDF